MNRRTLLTLFLTLAATSLGVSLVVPLLPVYAQEMGATGMELGLIFASFSLSRSILLPLVGNLADNWGRRSFMLVGLTVYSATAIGFAYTSNVYTIILTRLIQGAGAAMVVPVVRAYAGDMAEPGREGKLMGQINLAFMGGLAAGPWMGGFIKDYFGIRSAFYSMGLLSVFGLILTLLYLPRDIKHVKAATPTPTVSYINMICQPNLAAMFLFRFGTIIGIGVNWTFLPVFAHDLLKLSSSKIGILVSLTMLLTTISQPYFGRVADRVNRPWMTFWGGVLASASLMFAPFCRSFWELFFVNLSLGVFFGMYMPPLMAMAVDEGRANGMMTKVMSFLELAFSCGMVVGPLVAGLIEESLGLKAIFWFGGGVGLLTCLGFMVLVYRARRSNTSPA